MFMILAMQNVFKTISSSEYIFSFTSESDQKEILGLMEDKKPHTYFSGYVPDPFSYSPTSFYDKIIKPLKSETPTEKKKFSLFGWRKYGK